MFLRSEPPRGLWDDVVISGTLDDKDYKTPKDPAWALYTGIAAAALGLTVVFFVLLDLYKRYFSLRENILIPDGGPPASGGHHHTYTITVRADMASPTFDIKDSIIRIEVLDKRNQYLTSFVVPAFVLKFQEYPQYEDPQPGPSSGATPEPARPRYVIKALSFIRDYWAKASQTSELKFTLIRRMPLNDIAAVRINHDCYNPNALVILKCIVIKDDLRPLCYKVDLTGKLLRAMHPTCPPTGLQVFKAEPVAK